MALIPRSIVGKVLTGAWVLLCAGMLAFAWVQRGIHDMPEAFAWLMMFLSFPIGFPVAMIVGLATSAAETVLGIPYDPFWDLVPLWIALTVAGYVQWFVFVPFVWSRVHGKERAI